MGKFYYDKKSYPRWRDSDKLVHRTVAKPGWGEVTHHKDEDKGNFRSSNLLNMDRSDHSRYHAKKRSSFW